MSLPYLYIPIAIRNPTIRSNMFSNPLPSYVIPAVEFFEIAIDKAISAVSFSKKVDRADDAETKEEVKEDSIQEPKEKA